MGKKFESIEEKRSYERHLYKMSNGKYKDKAVARKRENGYKLSQFIWDYLKNHPCVDCSETDPVVLEFDHLHDKKFSIGHATTRNVSLKTLQEEIDKCEIRCANCHRKRTALQLGWYKNVQK